MLIMEPGEVLAKLVDFPIRVFEQGDVVLSEGSVTGRLLFLKQGLVDIVMEGVDLTRVSEPGAVFGEIGVLLGQPHTADVLAVQPASFYIVEDADAFLKAEPLVALYIAMVLAQRLNVVNHLVIEAKSRAAEEGQRRGFLMETLDRLGRALQIRTPR
jgi:CRP/FNR family transcriptional regulator, cyclic AMP receptor protein